MRPARQGDGATRAGSRFGNTAHCTLHWNSPGVLTLFRAFKLKTCRTQGIHLDSLDCIFFGMHICTKVQTHEICDCGGWRRRRGAGAIWTAACDPAKVMICLIFSVQIISLLSPSPSSTSLIFLEAMTNMCQTTQCIGCICQTGLI